MVKKTSITSAAGPSGIPYKVYEKCPKLPRRLWKLLKIIWRKGVVPQSWWNVEGILTPKEKDLTDLNQLRTISFFSLKGEICFAVLAKHMTKFMTDN